MAAGGERRSRARGAWVLVGIAAAAALVVALRPERRDDPGAANGREVRGAEPPAGAALEPARARSDGGRAAAGVPEDDAAAGPAREEAPAPLAGPIEGRVVVAVRELTHLPVEAALVRLHPVDRGGSGGERWIDADGRCAFEDVVAGRYWASVDPGSLRPEGYLPPAMQERANPYWRDPGWSRRHPGFYHEVVTIDAERREVELELVVAAPAFARGRVLDAAGSGVENVTIAFQRIGVAADAPSDVTDERGAYAIDDLRHGTYLPELRFHPDGDFPPGPDGRPVSTSSLPPPETVEVFPGDVVVRDFHIGRGDGEIVGRVVDQHGAPVAELDVLAYYEGWSMGSTAALVQTDADGTFALSGLHRTRLRVQVGGIWGAHPGPDRMGKKVLGEYPEQQEVDLASAARVDLGTVAVWRLEHVTFEGRVIVGDEARERYAIDDFGGRDEVGLFVLDGSDFRLSAGVCELDPGGSYSLSIPTLSTGERYAVLSLSVSSYRVESEPIWIPHEATTVRYDFVVD